MKKYSQKGFTLIELLVVIAIIGILSSVVLASLSTARNKAKDGAIQSQLNSLRTEAEIYYSTNNSYGGTAAVCTGAPFSSTSAQAIITAINADNGSVAADLACNITASAWAAQVQLLSTTDYVCVDSSGRVLKTTTVQTITDQACG